MILFFPFPRNNCSHSNIEKKHVYATRWKRSENSDTLEAYNCISEYTICNMCNLTNLLQFKVLSRLPERDCARSDLVRYKVIMNDYLVE